ncbi:MAG: hypothetical protein PHH70_04980, partial [Candidatus Gracilibacteria bacterium]|nr:hypothetical protein [Candidatus Gracilibacteria bacterium]
DNMSTNTFGSSVSSVTSSGCIAKKDMSLNTLDRSLVGYWDMESVTSSGLLKDLSGNGWNGKCYNSSLEASSGSCLTTGPTTLSGSMNFDGTIGKSVRILNSSGVLAGQKQLTIMGVVKGYCDTPTGNCIIIRTGTGVATVKSLNYPKGTFTSEVSTNNANYKFFSTNKISNTTDYAVMGTVTYDGQKVKIYENGTLKKQYDWTGSISNSGVDWYIGKMFPQDPTNSFSGSINEIKIYSRAISESEIKQQANIMGF